MVDVTKLKDDVKSWEVWHGMAVPSKTALFGSNGLRWDLENENVMKLL